MVWGLAAALVVLGAALYAQRDRLVERWLISRLDSGDESARWKAITRLGELRSRRAAPRLIDLAFSGSERDHAIRDRALSAIRSIGPEALPALLSALDDSPDLRFRAALTGTILEIDPDALREVLGALRSFQDLEALSVFVGPLRDAGPGIIPALGRSLPEVPPPLVILCASVLLHLRPEAGPLIEEAAVPALIGLLDATEEPALRGAALTCLAEYGVLARKAIPRLLELLRGADVMASLQAAAALAGIGPEAAPALMEELRRWGEDDPVPLFTAVIRLEQAHGGVIPLLITALEDPHAALATRSAMLLGVLGPEAVRAVPALRAARKREEPGLRNAAEEALKLLSE